MKKPAAPIIFCEQNSDGDRWYHLFDSFEDTFPFVKQVLDEIEDLGDGEAVELYTAWVNGKRELELPHECWLFIASDDMVTDHRVAKKPQRKYHRRSVPFGDLSVQYVKLGGL